MRVLSFFAALLVTFPNSPASAQTATTVRRDPQALAVLQQAVAVGGGTVLGSIQDFTATGSITYFWAGSQVQGTATIRALATTSFRVDANLPQGTRSWAVISSKGSTKETDGHITLIPRNNAMHLGALSFPQWKIASILNDPTLSVQYSGTVSFDSHRVNVVHVQLPVDQSTDQAAVESHVSAMDFLIDTTTYQVVAIRDALHPAQDSLQDVAHEISFADYRSVNGCLVPFTVTETTGGQQTWTMQVSSITFNTGLTSADFQL